MPSRRLSRVRCQQMCLLGVACGSNRRPRNGSHDVSVLPRALTSCKRTVPDRAVWGILAGENRGLALIRGCRQHNAVAYPRADHSDLAIVVPVAQHRTHIHYSASWANRLSALCCQFRLPPGLVIMQCYEHMVWCTARANGFWFYRQPSPSTSGVRCLQASGNKPRGDGSGLCGCRTPRPDSWGHQSRLWRQKRNWCAKADSCR